nr:MAG TPA: hypothetical protein [Caudoviricetes sp.]
MFTVSLPIVYSTLVRGLYCIVSLYILSLSIVLTISYPLTPLDLLTYIFYA